MAADLVFPHKIWDEVTAMGMGKLWCANAVNGNRGVCMGIVCGIVI
jgi:hypothetical protein